MDNVVKTSIQQLTHLIKSYQQADDDILKTTTPGAMKSAIIHLKYLKNRIKKKAESIGSMIHGKVLIVILETPKGRVKRMLTNISKEDFQKLCYDGRYHSYDILEITEIDTKTYEEPI